MENPTTPRSIITCKFNAIDPKKEAEKRQFRLAARNHNLKRKETEKRLASQVMEESQPQNKRDRLTTLSVINEAENGVFFI